MNAEIISIGTELLMGELVDTNSPFLAAELAKIGVEVRWVTKVGDDPELLREVIERAWERSDLTLTSGGLGPTSDDLTRESIAAAFGEKMTVQEDLLEHLKGLFAERGFPMPETNIKQATLIPSAESIPNDHGTAPGWWAEKDGRAIVAMPGPPREIQPMWASYISPKIKAQNPDVAIVTRNLKTFGISEGGLDEMLSPLFQSKNPDLGIYSKQDGIHLRAI
ncbi:MAG: competence/damage-inducible protein A, partial [Chloroflexi bacterium]|nr:competence/damage-inducible protein A [Chloroflexota bacterium]